MALRGFTLVLLIIAGLIATLPVTFAAETKTSKERLSGKGADEQRVDNCRVPLEQRGSTPRPDCAGEATSSTAATKEQRRTGPLKPR